MASFQGVEIKKKKINFYVIALLFFIFAIRLIILKITTFTSITSSMSIMFRTNDIFANYEKQFLL